MRKNLKHISAIVVKQHQLLVRLLSLSSQQVQLSVWLTSKSSPSFIYKGTSSRQKLITDSLVQNLIIGCSLPISIVDNEHFRKFLSDIDPKYVPPCRQTVTYSLVPKLVERNKEKLQDELNKCRSVALTADIWTDRRQIKLVMLSLTMLAI